MNPFPFHTSDYPSGNVPAVVREDVQAREVVVRHPSNNAAYPTVLATITRYEAKGWRAVFVPTPMQEAA